MAKKKHRNLFFGITSRALMTAAAGLLLLSYLSALVNPAKAWLFVVFGLLYIPLAALNLLLLLWALKRRSGAFAIPLLALLPTFFIIGRYYQAGKTPEEDPEGVRIVSYNVGRFALAREGLSSSACADSVVSLLRGMDADIICLQEFYFNDSRRLREYLASRFKGYDIEYFVYPTADGCYGNVTLSRFPATGKGKIDFEGSANLALYCDYDINGTRTRVYNCHFQSYNISLPGIAKSLSRDYKATVKDTEERMRASISRRPRQVDQVLEDIENCPTDAIVTGDFNDTPMSYTYNRLRKGRLDTFVEAGKGTGATYTYFRPFLRIDYVLSPEQFPVSAHKVMKRPFSDHYPIIANISI